MIRLLIFFSLLFFLQNCISDSSAPLVDSAPPASKDTSLVFEDWLKQQPIDSSITRHLVFAIDPQDCINCILTFGELFRKMVVHADAAHQIHVIFPKTRAIERPEAIRAVFGKLDTTGIRIVWDTQLLQQAVDKVKTGEGYSSFLIYTATGQLLFARYGRTLIGTEPELQPFLH